MYVTEKTGTLPRVAGNPRLTRAARRRLLLMVMPGAVLAVLVAAIAVANPNFLRAGSIWTVLDSAVPILILATGAMLVILCGGIDLSVAALASLASVLVALWIPLLGGWAVPAVVLLCALAGLLQGAIHVVAQIPSFLVTLGGMAVWAGLALVISGAATIGVSGTTLDWAFTRVGDARIPSAVLIAAALVVVVAVVLQFTPLRRWLVAIGSSESAALMAGVPVAQTKMAVLAVSGACAGFAGVMLVGRTFSGAPSLADSLLLPVVAAIVVGGTAITGGFGGIGRTVIGVLIITVLRVGLSVAGVDSSYEQIFYGVLVIGAVALTIDRSKLPFVK
ncbi:ABC transporter permease [uncultured Microbacterium sp.]|uniref:Inner-membrane translocator n=1 Tax=uncultured Microbacterium sp. TaxID=191216 RepID=A0A1Y5P8I9_9MICO|nr:ABC transporter permease [uncultured Microbacterium sp.]SBS73639.1 Inner-membrane translocator [uncultured Microbacterium sp.]